MTTSLLSKAIEHLRKAVLLHEEAGLTDGQLLGAFVERGDEAAFAALVRRHGPMVLGVCRRVLRNHHDTEDAFQATFLVLVRKAASIVPREMVANWLYGVAYHTALKARATTAKRQSRERQTAEMPETETETVTPDLWHYLQPLLDQELNRLPDKYRVPIVLCDLEGKTHKEAARRLRWPIGTLSGRLARARAMLAKRLTRHGVVLSAVSLAAVLSQNTASACVRTSLTVSTIKAAGVYAAGQAAGVVSAKVVALTEGVLKSMLLTQLTKWAVAILLVAGIAVTSAVLTSQKAPAQPLAEKKPSQVADFGAFAQANQDDEKNNKDDGDKNNKDDGDKNNKDDGDKNQKDDGDKNNKDDGDKNNKDDGQKNEKGNGSGKP